MTLILTILALLALAWLALYGLVVVVWVVRRLKAKAMLAGMETLLIGIVLRAAAAAVQEEREGMHRFVVVAITEEMAARG